MSCSAARPGVRSPLAPYAMASLFHEGLLDLFRNRPTLAPELLRDAIGAALPAFDHVRVGDANVTDIVPTEFRADLVLLLERRAAAGPRGAIVLEVQLRADADKRWSWPAYLVGLRARFRCGVVLLVVTGDEAVAGRGLDDARATLYADLIFASVHEAARVLLEGLMANRNYEYQSDFARRYVAQGRAEGEASGEARGEARALLHVLQARGIDVPEAVRTRILGCTDLAVLDGWLARALTATSASEVVGE